MAFFKLMIFGLMLDLFLLIFFVSDKKIMPNSIKKVFDDINFGKSDFINKSKKINEGALEEMNLKKT